MTEGTIQKRHCSVQDCERPHHSLGLCSKHGSRLKRFGSPLALSKREERRLGRNHFCVGDTAFIQCSDGSYVLCDAGQYALVMKHSWARNQGYATTNITTEGTQHYVPMHHVVYPKPSGWVTDHINRERGDNRRRNLRHVTRMGNAWNAKRRRNNTSGCTGVFFRKKKWIVVLRVRHERINVGRFTSYEEAVSAYQLAKGSYHDVETQTRLEQQKLTGGATECGEGFSR